MKKRIAWSASIQTGNRSIDVQHGELIDLINSLAQLVETSSSKVDISETLQQLERYVLFHFNNEENMMVNYRISTEHVIRHIAAHDDFAMQVKAFRHSEHLEMKPSEIVDYLVDWLTNHIMRTDQELVALCRWPEMV